MKTHIRKPAPGNRTQCGRDITSTREKMVCRVQDHHLVTCAECRRVWKGNHDA